MANPFADERGYDDDLLHDGTEAGRKSILVLDKKALPIGIDDDSGTNIFA